MMIATDEKDRWWLIGLSIAFQQALFAQEVWSFFAFVSIFPRYPIFAIPVVFIWSVSFFLSFRLAPKIGMKACFRAYAKSGWLYVLGSFVWLLVAHLWMASHIGGLCTTLVP
jgi:hypothetical protein